MTSEARSNLLSTSLLGLLFLAYFEAGWRLLKDADILGPYTHLFINLLLIPILFVVIGLAFLRGRQQTKLLCLLFVPTAAVVAQVFQGAPLEVVALLFFSYALVALTASALSRLPQH